MARIARVVVPGFPHHVTQRGNRRQQTFFCDEDYRAYMRFVSRQKERAGARIWAYCLMPNHVHFVVVPEHEQSLAILFKESHRKYTRRINLRNGWCGHLWQGRYFSFPMDERHAIAAVRYAELNPVNARLCKRPADWRWSSVHAHIRGKEDLLVDIEPMLSQLGNWNTFLSQSANGITEEALRSHGKTGRPAGDSQFIQKLEEITGRVLVKQKPGPKKN